MRPVLKGMLRAESLLDNKIDLAFIALLNEAIDVENENSWRAQQAAVARARKPRK